MTEGLVSRILPFSSVDGPGNRTTVFLQGCNLSCRYCHNPETINICSGCGSCIPVCPSGALSVRDGKIFHNMELCIDCGGCLNACPENSTPRMVKTDTAALMNTVRPWIPFTSGVTFSGGEPLLQVQFIIEFSILYRQTTGKTVFIDTNGTIPLQGVSDVLSAVDGVMIDAKNTTAEGQQFLTGKEWAVLEDNIRIASSRGILHEVRTVLQPDIPGIEETVDTVSRLPASLNSETIYKLIRFRRQGVRGEYKEMREPDGMFVNALEKTALKNKCRVQVV